MPRPVAPDAPPSLLAPAGALLAVVLPHAVFSLSSPDALYEVKGFAQALAASGLLAGLAFLPGASRTEAPGVPARLARAAVVALWAFSALSAVVGIARGTDPLVAVSVLAPAALFLWGASDAGASASGRLLAVAAGAGALTGALAALQRFAGVLRLPLDAPEPRFWASALLGNPGDVAASLVLPAILLWARLDSAGRDGGLALTVLGAAGVLAGLMAAGAVAPVLAAAAGVCVHAVLAPRRRLPRLAAVAIVLAAALGASGTGRRLVEKALQAARGDVGGSLTQRDIGYLSAAEMIRSHPLVGVGPGGFAAAFVPARLAAEERARRHMVHSSLSSHFENAHSDPLTLAAECGLPAAAAAGVALLALLASLARGARAGRPPGDGGPDAGLLLALLAGFLVLGLASFPLRIPSAVGPAAFVLGLAWRRTGARGAVPLPSGARRPLLLATAAFLGGAASVRFAAVALQTSGERAVRVAPLAPSEVRGDLLETAERRLRLSLALRPRHATARLALAAAHGLSGRLGEAVDEMERSLRLEERAETALGLGRLLSARGDTRRAHALFVRAVWTLPALVSAIPDTADPEGVRRDVARHEAGIASGVPPPPLPEGLGAPWPVRPRSPSGPR